MENTLIDIQKSIFIVYYQNWYEGIISCGQSGGLAGFHIIFSFSKDRALSLNSV